MGDVDLVGPEGGCSVQGSEYEYICTRVDHWVTLGKWIEQLVEWAWYYVNKCGPSTIPVAKERASADASTN